MHRDVSGRTITFEMSAWYDEKDGHIHLVALGREGFITTVSGNSESERGHPHLFKNLAVCLKKAGVPYPAAETEEHNLRT